MPGTMKPTWPLPKLLGERFKNLYSNWEKASQPIDANIALINERDTLYETAKTIFYEGDSPNVVIFGHTHDPLLNGIQSFDADDEYVFEKIYANSGTWIDSGDPDKGGTYVETEEVVEKGEKRLYVRLKRYTRTDDSITKWGFVKL